MTAELLSEELRRLTALMGSNADDAAPAPPPPGVLAQRIAATFKLREIDVDLCLATLGREIDHEFAAVLHASGATTELGLLAALVGRVDYRLALRDAIGSEAPAIRAGLLRRLETDGTAALSPTRRFRAAAFADHVLSSLPEYATRITTAPRAVPWTDVPPGLLEAMKRSTSSALCVVSGPPGVGKTTWARWAAHSIHGAALHIDVAKAARAGRDVSLELRELVEDATLVGWPAILDNVGVLLSGENRLSLLVEDVLERTPAKLFLVLGNESATHDAITSRSLAHVHIEPPPARVRRELWSVARIDAQLRNTLADDLVLTPRQIQNAIDLVEAGADPSAAAFAQIPKRQNLTLPDRTTAKLDALVLPAEVRAEVVELIRAIRVRGTVFQKLQSARGRAITALFDGDSGTGKTFACEVVAAEVGLPLMRVNVASLVDKYIGETEKNLARVFAQAQALGGILFFDEADALFGNRTDVSKAQDRYANLETNLLLQLMEQFSGVVLLTTNLKKNIDQAFMRRIMFKVYFDVPEPAERARLWRSVVPAAEFEDGIDFARLAETFKLTGGSIRAAALRAAYRAAAAGGKISMSDLVECAQLETQGSGRVATWHGGGL